MQGWREQDAGEVNTGSNPAFAAAAVGTAVSGRALSVEERQAKASRDIAAAKARQAAFASQGERQFTDTDIAQPDTSEFDSSSGSHSPSSATATMALDDVQTPSASPQSSNRTGEPSGRSPEGSTTGTFEMGQGDSSATDTFELGSSGTQSEDENPTGTFMLDTDRPQDSSDRSSRQQSVYEPDTSKPLYAQGRADLKPRAVGEHDARANAQAELQKQSRQKQTLASGQSGADTSDAAEDGRSASVYEPDTSKPLYAQGRADLKPRAEGEHNARANAQAELKAKSKQMSTPEVSAAEPVRSFRADQSAADASDEPDQGRPAPVYEPDTSKPLYAQGRADLKPRAMDEQNARANAQAKLKAKSKQTITPEVSAAEAVRRFKADQSAAETSDKADQGRPAPVYEPDTSKPLYAQGQADLKPRAVDEQNARANAQAELKAKSKQTITPEVSAAEAVRKFKTDNQSQPQAASDAASDQARSDTVSSKAIAGGRAPAGEHEARQKAQAELKNQSQQQQPVTGVSSDLAAAIYKPRASDKQQSQQQRPQQLMSDKDQTDDLASGLTGASMSAQPKLAPSDQSRSASKPSPLQSQQRASSMPAALSSASSFAPAQQEPQNPLQGLLSAFQGLFGGQGATGLPSGSSSLVSADQARPATLTSSQQVAATVLRRTYPPFC